MCKVGHFLICCHILFVVLFQKRKERTTALEKSNLPEASKVKWRKVMDNLLMSSEESDEETGSGNSSGTNSRILRKHKITFRSDKVDAFFSKLDSLSKDDKKTSSLGARLLIPRREGSPSSRTLPDKHNLPSWAIKF